MENNRLVLLAVGDVGPIHEPMENYSALVRDTLRGADLRFAQVERVYSGTPFRTVNWTRGLE